MSKKAPRLATKKRQRAKSEKATRKVSRLHIHQGQTLYAIPIGPPTLAQYQGAKQHAENKARVQRDMNKQASEWKADDAETRRAAGPMMTTLCGVLGSLNKELSAPLDMVNDLSEMAGSFAYGNALGFFFREHRYQVDGCKGECGFTANSEVESGRLSHRYQMLRSNAKDIYFSICELRDAIKNRSSCTTLIAKLNSQYEGLRDRLAELDGSPDNQPRPNSLLGGIHPVQTDPPAFTPSDPDIYILDALAQRNTRCCASKLRVAGIGERVKGQRLRILEGVGLVERIDGVNSGWAITGDGQKVRRRRADEAQAMRR